jgi:hypothetical protein
MVLTPRHLRRSELMFSWFRCNLECEHRTDVNTQLSKFVVSLGVRCSPGSPATFAAHPPAYVGFGQTGRTIWLQPTPPLAALAAWFRLQKCLLFRCALPAAAGRRG